MKIENLNESIKLARIFILKTNEFQRRYSVEGWTLFGCKESATVKRASMDLTRILAKLRNER